MTGRLVRLISLAKEVGLKGKYVADVGCSFGWFCQIALDQGAKAVYGVDPDADQIARAKQEVPKAKFVQGYAADTHLPANKFDVVTLFDVIEHVPPHTENEVFAHLATLLKKDGQLLICTPHDHPVAKLADPAWYFGHRHYSAEGLTAMLESSGFIVEKTFTHGGLWEIVGVWVLYFSKWILHIPMPAEEWFDVRRRREFTQPGFTHLFVQAYKQ